MKMTYEGAACEITASENFRFSSHVPCSLELDSILYAVCRFFQKSKKLRRDCIFESWQLRIIKASRKKKRHTYVIPAMLMELPGAWAEVHIMIDSSGVAIQQVKLLQQHPLFQSHSLPDLKNHK